MKNMKNLIALIMALLLLTSATTAFAGTYVSDAVSPSIAAPSQGEATPQPEVSATPAPEDGATPAPEVSATPAPEGQEGGVQEVDAVVATEDENGRVNIRSAPSADAEIIGQLTAGMSVRVLGIEGDWTKVHADGVTGYVYSDYISIPAQAEPEVTPAPETTPAVEQKISVSANRDVRSLQPGDALTLSAQLTGFEGVSYTLQWQVRKPDGSWQDIDGATDTTLTIHITEEHNGCSWRLQAKTGE